MPEATKSIPARPVGARAPGDRSPADAPRDPQKVPDTALTSSDSLVIANDVHVEVTLHTDGDLRVGRKAVLGDRVTSNADAHIGDGARIRGHLEVKGTTRWGRAASAGAVVSHGPFVTHEGRVLATRLVTRKGVHPFAATGIATDTGAGQ